MLVQLNLQPYFGGGEVYSAFLCKALSTLGVPTRLLVHPRATYWRDLGLPGDTELVAVSDPDSAGDAIGAECRWLIGHGPLSQPLRERMRQRRGLATAMVHMPVQGRSPDVFKGHDMLFAVSAWVLQGLHEAGLTTWPTPLYGVAHLARSGGGALRRTSCYDWDRRKFRDRAFSWLEPGIERFRPHPAYRRKPGLTLGVVSRLTPIKQFPVLFKTIAGAIAATPGVNVEVFGSGGYASVRDLRQSMNGIGDRVRFWGYQSDVAAAYAGIDYLLTGLPEKEALGLNVIEAQTCGTPVLAPNAPPFTETVVDGVTGFLYRDPREDHGEDFAQLLNRLLALPERPDPRLAVEHLARFSLEAFVERLRPIVAWVESELGR